MILQRDIRTPPLQSERRLQGHRQEVCGLKWSTDHQLLASGGNDNKVGPAPALPPSPPAPVPWSRGDGCTPREAKMGPAFPWGPSCPGLTAPSLQLLVWNHSSLSPVQQYTEHLAAVKAIAWSPHQHGLLASGGGTADRCIRFWNTLTGQPLQCIDTGSQVCNLAWSKHANELVSAGRRRPGPSCPGLAEADPVPVPSDCRRGPRALMCSVVPCLEPVIDQGVGLRADTCGLCTLWARLGVLVPRWVCLGGSVPWGHWRGEPQALTAFSVSPR